MLDRVACATLSVGCPRCSVPALYDLRRLLEALGFDGRAPRAEAAGRRTTMKERTTTAPIPINCYYTCPLASRQHVRWMSAKDGMSTRDEDFDVVVVGGGPAGSTAATLVAMQGHRVLLLEKAKLPVYKIGESLVPATVHGICAILGVSDEMRAANFVRKLGGTFRWGKSKEPWTFTFAASRKFAGPTSYAYQVERIKFDKILLDNARRKGVDVREEHRVSGLIVDADRVGGVKVIAEAGDECKVRARYVIDASGHASTIAAHAGERIYSKTFRNLAVFGYYENGKRLEEPNAGNIVSVAFDKGWFWYIPLSETLSSVGAVIGEEYSAVLRRGKEEALTELIGQCEFVRTLLSGATRVTVGTYGNVRVRKDFSYCSMRFWRKGLVLVGDAACFIDPVFSSGVHLATYSALVAARSINSYLCEAGDETRLFSEFERRYTREYMYFHDFLLAFYNLDQDLDGYYWAARQVLGSSDDGKEAFIQLVGGIGGSTEPLPEPKVTHLRPGREVSKQLFPLAGNKGQHVIAVGQGGDATRQFMTALRSESVQMQLQQGVKNVLHMQTPLFEGGLVASRDGLRWVEPDSEM
jgi:FAD-dependent halogenase